MELKRRKKNRTSTLTLFEDLHRTTDYDSTAIDSNPSHSELDFTCDQISENSEFRLNLEFLCGDLEETLAEGAHHGTAMPSTCARTV
jgi:hypothetical protein